MAEFQEMVFDVNDPVEAADVTNEEFLDSVGRALMEEVEELREIEGARLEEVPVAQLAEPATRIFDADNFTGVHNDTEANAMVEDVGGIESSYKRTVYAPSTRFGDSNIEYRLRGSEATPEYAARSDIARQRQANSAVINERMDFPSMIRTVAQAYRNELTRIGPAKYIASAMIYYADSQGHVYPIPIYIPASMLEYGMKSGRRPEDMTMNDVIEFLDEATEISTNNNYDELGRKDGVNGSDMHLYPQEFTFVVKPLEGSGMPRLPETFVEGLTRAQKDMIMRSFNKLKSIKGNLVENLDRRSMGYCLFDTVAAMTGIDPNVLVEQCGSPKPSSISVEAYGNMVANYARINLRFYRISETRQLHEFYRTQTNYYRTEHLLVVCIKDESNEDQNMRLYNHVFRLLAVENKADDVKPFTVPTVFVNVDLESIVNYQCVNSCYSLNLLAYRFPPTIETFKPYDTLALDRGFEVLDTAIKQWYKVLVRAEDKDGGFKTVLNEFAHKAPVVFVSGMLDALRELLPFLENVKQCCGGGKIHIILTGFNSSRYDNFILITYLKKILGLGKDKIQIGLFGNSILTYTITLGDLTITTWDIRRHVTGSLRGCCSNWEVPTGGEKGDLNHRLIQTIYNMDPDNFGKFIEANFDDHTFTVGDTVNTYKGIKTYCAQDVIASALLHFQYKTKMEYLVNQHFIEHYGCSLGMLRTMRRIDFNDPEQLSKFAKDCAFNQQTLDAIAVAKKISTFTELKRLPFDINVVDTTMVKFTPVMEAMVKDVVDHPSKAAEVTSNIMKYMGGRITKAIEPNIECYPTLAGFATAVFNLITKTNGMKQVRGFNHRISKLLRKHTCIAGRSQGKIGFFQVMSYLNLDCVSLYPTAMDSHLISYVLGSTDTVTVGSKKVKRDTVECTYHQGADAALESLPVNGTFKAGIFRVIIKNQPNGIVIPPKTISGYHWSKNIQSPLWRLMVTPDVESLRVVGADFEIIDCNMYDLTTDELYSEYLSIAANEKNRQDMLKKDPLNFARFPGEKFSLGIREACKLFMNILSGKEITRAFVIKREVYDNEALPCAIDTANAQRIFNLSEKARAAVDMNDPAQLKRWRECKKKIDEIPRLTKPPFKIGENTWVGEWKCEPAAGKYSHINGYHIYGGARLIMNRCYAKIGFDNYVLTETDSMAVPVNDIPKLYDSKSVRGDNLIYANDEIKLGLLNTPVCPKSKQFGQLECDMTETLVKVVAKYWGKVKPHDDVVKLASRDSAKPPKMMGDKTQVERLEYKAGSTELMVKFKGEELKSSNLKGPFVACGGKKIYAYYMLEVVNRETGIPYPDPALPREIWQFEAGKSQSVIFIKARFKGVSIGHDYVIEQYRIPTGPNAGRPSQSTPGLYLQMNNMTRRQKLDYMVARAGIEAGMHILRKRDIFDYIRDGVMYVVQQRIAQNSTRDLLSRQDVIVKVLNRKGDELTDKENLEILRASQEVQELNMLQVCREMSNYDRDVATDYQRCEMCDAPGIIVVSYKAYCPLHVPTDAPNETPLCLHLGRNGKFDCGVEEKPGRGDRESGHVCETHATEQPIYCDEEGCEELAYRKEVEKGRRKCKKHGFGKTVPGLACLFKSPRQKGDCPDPVSKAAMKAEYQLCYRHYSQYNKTEKRARIAQYRCATGRAQVEALETAAATSNREGCKTLCTYVTPKTKKECLQPVVEGTTLCRKHTRRQK